MKNTSKGYHTFAFFQKTKEEEYDCLESAFIGYMRETGKLKRYPIKDHNMNGIGWEFTYKENGDKGIRWRLLSIRARNGYFTGGIMAIINPKVLIERDYITAAGEADLEGVEELFNKKAAEISPGGMRNGKGSYFTLDSARSIVESYHFRRSKEERIIYALELVKKYRGIAKAKDRLLGPDLDDFKRSLEDLDNMLINPVTIPRRWNINHIPNLLRAYDDAGIEEKLMPMQEYLAWEHIAEYLSE